MRWFRRYKNKPPLDKWHRWFAWFPVYINGYTYWLSYVERRGKWKYICMGDGEWQFSYREAR